MRISFQFSDSEGPFEVGSLLELAEHVTESSTAAAVALAAVGTAMDVFARRGGGVPTPVLRATPTAPEARRTAPPVPDGASAPVLPEEEAHRLLAQRFCRMWRHPQGDGSYLAWEPGNVLPGFITRPYAAAWYAARRALGEEPNGLDHDPALDSDDDEDRSLPSALVYAIVGALADRASSDDMFEDDAEDDVSSRPPVPTIDFANLPQAPAEVLERVQARCCPITLKEYAELTQPVIFMSNGMPQLAEQSALEHWFATQHQLTDPIDVRHRLTRQDLFSAKRPSAPHS